jgi:hypothetical protein
MPPGGLQLFKLVSTTIYHARVIRHNTLVPVRALRQNSIVAAHSNHPDSPWTYLLDTDPYGLLSSVVLALASGQKAMAFWLGFGFFWLRLEVALAWPRI